MIMDMLGNQKMRQLITDYYQVPIATVAAL